MTAAKTLRCAIYTRVSSDQGLEQDFNSLHAQREAAEAYIKSQAHEGWRLRRTAYDDGGFSGGSMERPALQALLADVAARRLDIILVYKVDRLTRSLADFAKLVELFDKHEVSFVSVTQSFNTTSSMGRLTLNVLLSFAQFEREVTGERIRDKIAASKKKGIWMGGVVPLGYRVESRKLVVAEQEAETVQLIYERYLELGSLPALQRELNERGIRSRPRALASGRAIGDVPLTNGPLSQILKNRMYLGELNHKGSSYKSDHPAIVTPELFAAVQARLAQNLNRSDLRKGSTGALLKGCLFDDRGNLMSPTHAVKKGVRYRYYVSTALAQGRKGEAGTIARLPAHEVETIVLDALLQRLPPGKDDDQSAAELFKAIDLRVNVQSQALEITWAREPASSNAGKVDCPVLERETARSSPSNQAAEHPAEQREQHEDDDERLRLIVPYVPNAHKRVRDIILPANMSGYIRPIEHHEQRNLVRSIAQGRAWLQEIVAGATAGSIALRESKSERAVRMTLSLAFLDPKLVRAALHGGLPRGVSAKRLIDAPANWQDQWRTIGLARPS